MTETSFQTPLRYTLTQKDQWRYYQYAVTHLSSLSPFLQVMYLAYFGCLFCCFGFLAYMLADTRLPAGVSFLILVKDMVLPIVVGGVLGAVIGVIIRRLMTNFYTYHNFNFRPEMLKCYQGSKIRIFRRNAIYSLVDEIEYIYLNTKTGFLIVPKRAFATALDAHVYYEQINNWWHGDVAVQEGVWPPAPQVKG